MAGLYRLIIIVICKQFMLSIILNKLVFSVF